MKTYLQSLPRTISKRTGQGFTLVEMLVVISIVSVLSLLASTAFSGIAGPVMDRQVSDLASTLSRARAYAMANNTYVFVGIQEDNVATASTATQTTGTGRVVVTVVASEDGTRGYQLSNPAALSSLSVVSPVRRYDNLHLVASPDASISAKLPNVAASEATSNAYSTTSLTTFTWPLGSASPQYPTFGSNGTVIQFSPQGEAQIVSGPYTDLVLQWIEIDLQGTHGSQGNVNNPATILIDGASGSVTTYRK